MHLSPTDDDAVCRMSQLEHRTHAFLSDFHIQVFIKKKKNNNPSIKYVSSGSWGLLHQPNIAVPHFLSMHPWRHGVNQTINQDFVNTQPISHLKVPSETYLTFCF